MNKGILSFLGACLISMSAEAITIHPGDTIKMDYDFSGDASSGPWTRSPGAVVLADNSFSADVWDQFTSVELSIYDSSDLLLGSAAYTRTSHIVPSNMSNAIEFTSQTADPFGYVILTSIDAQFDFIGVDLVLQNPGITQTSYQLLTPATVPLPTAVWLFGSGLIGLIGVARRKKA